MFTSRAEYRLTLRADNADQRLTDRGIALGCVDVSRETLWIKKRDALESARNLMKDRLQATPNELEKNGLSVNKDGRRRSAFDLLGYPGVDWAALARIWPEMAQIPAAVREQVEIDAGYAGYMDRQEADIRAFRKDEALVLPADIDYAGIGSLSTEIRVKLSAARPATLGAAARIPGVTPAAVIALLRHVKRQNVDDGDKARAVGE